MTDDVRKNTIPFFFVVGRARSGTTLLRYMLEAHPNIVFPQEADFIITLANKYSKRKYWSEQHILSFFHDVINYPKFQFWNINEKVLKDALLNQTGANTYSQLCKTVYLQFTSNNPKEEILWLGDKNPIYSLHIKKLLRLFPEARFIHICRDPRDNVLSMYNAGFERKIISALAYRWGYYIRKIKRAENKFPERFFTLRYEDLVKDPEPILQNICTFLNIPYDKKMLGYFDNLKKSMNDYPAELITRYHKSLLEPLNESNVGKWEKYLSPAQIKIIEFASGSSMTTMGYEKKFSGISFAIVLKSLPGLLYGWLQFPVIYLINLLPYGIKIRAVKLIASIFKQKWYKYRKK